MKKIKKSNVLYVEDEMAHFALLCSANLRAGNLINIDHAIDGKNAYRLLYAHKYDFIMLDLNLPDTNGFEILSTIRDKKSFDLVPVVIFSSSERPEEAEKALSLGADDYITKPMMLNEWEKIVTRLSRRYQAVEANSLSLLSMKHAYAAAC